MELTTPTIILISVYLLILFTNLFLYRIVCRAYLKASYNIKYHLQLNDENNTFLFIVVMSFIPLLNLIPLGMCIYDLSVLNKHKTLKVKFINNIEKSLEKGITNVKNILIGYDHDK